MKTTMKKLADWMLALLLVIYMVPVYAETYTSNEVQTDAVVKNEDEEIVDYSNYQPTEPKEEDIEADEKDSLVDEDKIYKD